MTTEVYPLCRWSEADERGLGAWHRRWHSATTLQIRCVSFTYASYQNNQNKNEETSVLIHIIFAIPPPQNKKLAHQLSPVKCRATTAFAAAAASIRHRLAESDASSTSHATLNTDS